MKKSNTLIALGTLAAMTATSMSGIGTQPVQAKGFIRRHPLLSAAIATGGYLAYRHHQRKKHHHHMMYRRSTMR